MIKTASEEDAYLILSWISDSIDAKICEFIEKFGAEEAIQIISKANATENNEKKRLARLKAFDSVEYLKDQLGLYSLNYISNKHSKWPKNLNDLRNQRPFGLFYKGSIDNFAKESISIVGTRKSSNYGNTIAGEFSFDLASLGFNVVSGGALGIDTSSHHGALNAKGTTICVQANGLHKLYPSKNEFLFEKIIKTGLMISEYPPGRSPTKKYFLERNRIIAGLSKATMVIEAPEISGALSTARHALRMQRLVLAIPGSIYSETSRGTNELIRNREAESVTNLQQVLELILPLGHALS